LSFEYLNIKKGLSLGNLWNFDTIKKGLSWGIRFFTGGFSWQQSFESFESKKGPFLENRVTHKVLFIQLLAG
jgi:hypothetical protein